MPPCPDPFDTFASDYDLHLSADEMVLMPRDIAAPPTELERPFVVTLVRRQSSSAPLLLTFVSASPNEEAPSQRDVLWWLASDAWALEKAAHDYSRWLALHGYVDDASALRAFRLHDRQSRALIRLLGADAYAALVSLHEQQVSTRSPHQ